MHTNECPSCGASRHKADYIPKDVRKYLCGSDEDSRGYRQTDECKARSYDRVTEERDAIKTELITLHTLLADILPLAMGASCFFHEHPDADESVHCCDWGPIVDRICVALGREVSRMEVELRLWATNCCMDRAAYTQRQAMKRRGSER